VVPLSELWFLYRCTGQEKHQKDYSYFGSIYTDQRGIYTDQRGIYTP